MYSRYAGTELEFNGCNHLLLKEDDLLGILETDDIKDLKPLNDRILIKVCQKTIISLTQFSLFICVACNFA